MTQISIEPDISTSEQIWRVATKSFARHGYHGTSVREIARQVGISVATLYYYVNNKEDLYRKVFQRQFQEENELIEGVLNNVDESVIQNPTALRKMLYHLMDVLIDRSIQNPDVVRLWTRRWLEKPANTENIESEFSLPLYQKVESWLERARAARTIQPEAIRLDLLLRSFTWLHYGYCGYGRLTFGTLVDENGSVRCDPEQVEEFRSFVHLFVDKMLRFADQG